MINRITTLIYQLKQLRKPKRQSIEIYDAGKDVGEAQVVLFMNSDDVMRCKLEEDIRSLEQELATINARLAPMEKELREKHRKLWNY